MANLLNPEYTLVQTGRRAVATELDPKFCAVILERMASYGLNIEKAHGLV